MIYQIPRITFLRWLFLHECKALPLLKSFVNLFKIAGDVEYFTC